MADTLQVLRAARDLISEPSRWTQGCYARDIRGDETTFAHPDAVCFCALGAVYRAAGNTHVYDPASNDAEHALFWATDTEEVPHFNDSHTHAEVLALFDKAIAAQVSEANE